MISYLSGKLISVDGAECTVLVSGIGYQVFVPFSFAENLSIDTEIQLYIHTIVRETEISLYGFASPQEKKLFALLISVSGIGPKTALSMMALPMQKLIDAIALGDTDLLSSLPGIGTKTAARIHLDLKDKISDIQIGGAKKETVWWTATIQYTEIVNALIDLGYERTKLMKVLQNIPPDIVDEQAIMKYVIKNSK